MTKTSNITYPYPYRGRSPIRILLLLWMMVLSFGVLPHRAYAQEIVIDPSQIAASAANSAEQIDYMIQQLSELASLSGKISDLKSHADNVYGQTLSKGIVLLRSLGTLESLTKAYAASIEQISSYAKRIESQKGRSLSDYAALVGMLSSSRSQAELTIQTARGILSETGLTKKEKKDMIDELTRELNSHNRKIREEIEMELAVGSSAKGLDDLISITELSLDPKEYVSSRKSLGTLSRGSVTGLSAMVLMLLGCLSLGYGYFAVGKEDNVYLRIGLSMLAGVIMLSVLSKVFGI